MERVAPRPWGPRRARTATAGLLLALGLAACGRGAERPAASEWRTGFESLTEQVPSADDLRSSDARARCSDALAALRREEAVLSPAPDPVLDEAAVRWLEVAKGLAYDCPSDPAEIRDRLGALAERRAEVEAALRAKKGD